MSKIITKKAFDEFGTPIEILVSDNCCYCKWYEQDGEYYELQIPAYQTCNKRPQMANLKGFPFRNKLECFEPDGVKR